MPLLSFPKERNQTVTRLAFAPLEYGHFHIVLNHSMKSIVPPVFWEDIGPDYGIVVQPSKR